MLGLVSQGWGRWILPFAFLGLELKHIVGLDVICLCGQETRGFGSKIVQGQPHPRCLEGLMIKGVDLQGRGGGESGDTVWARPVRTKGKKEKRSNFRQ